MPLYPVNFPVLSPQQANPFGFGMQQGAQTMGAMQDARMRAAQAGLLNAQLPYAGQMAQQDLLKNQLANALSQNTLNYAPQMSAADLAVKKAMPGLYGSESQKNAAQAALFTTQNQYYPYQVAGNLDPVKLAIARMLTMPGSTNASMPGASASPSSSAMPPITSSDGGMTLQPANSAGSQPVSVPMRPPSSYPVLPGGLGASQGQQVLQGLAGGPQGAAPASSNGGMPSLNDLFNLQYANMVKQYGKDPTMGTNRGGQGGTFYNPMTGQTTSSDTTTNTTMDQQTSASIQRIQPILQSLSKNLSPFQTLGGDAKLRIGQGLNYALGTNFDSPNQYAQGQADLKTAPESLIRAFGLRVTNEALDRMQAAVEPRFGETGTAYQNRITNELNTLKEYQSQANSRLKSGMNVDEQQSTQRVAQMPPTSKIINGATYHKINGQWYAQ